MCKCVCMCVCVCLCLCVCVCVCVCACVCVSRGGGGMSVVCVSKYNGKVCLQKALALHHCTGALTKMIIKGC